MRSKLVYIYNYCSQMPGRQPRYLKLGPLYDDPPTMDRNDPPAQKPKPKPKVYKKSQEHHRPPTDNNKPLPAVYSGKTLQPRRTSTGVKKTLMPDRNGWPGMVILIRWSVTTRTARRPSPLASMAHRKALSSIVVASFVTSTQASSMQITGRRRCGR